MINLMAQRIRQRRKALGMTQQELAEKAGYTSKAMIARIQAGIVDIPQSRIVAIADALNVDAGWMLGLDQEWPTIKQIVDMYNAMSEQSKRDAVDYFRFLLQRDQRNLEGR